jgi:hypothetical protein
MTSTVPAAKQLTVDDLQDVFGEFWSAIGSRWECDEDVTIEIADVLKDLIKHDQTPENLAYVLATQTA